MQTLSSEGIDDLLTRCGVGVLSLFDGTYPYAIPMSFGYDGERPIFAVQFGLSEDSHKQHCLEHGRKACFTVYDRPAPGTWHSAVVRGELVEVPDDETESAFAALAANATFPADVRVWGVPLAETDLQLYRLAIEERTGREFAMPRESSE